MKAKNHTDWACLCHRFTAYGVKPRIHKFMSNEWEASGAGDCFFFELDLKHDEVLLFGAKARLMGVYSPSFQGVRCQTFDS